MKVKICGITNIEDALYAVECGADALGFVFYKNSKRYIKPEKAKEIISHLPPFVFSVGVFVNENPEKVNMIASETKLNAVQLHGDEDLTYLAKINYPIIKAFGVNENFDWNVLSKYECNILLDTYSNNYGGSGEKFDWNLIPNEIRNRIILSGGIDVNSLSMIVNEIKPAAIDLSSSLEQMPGKKDHNKIKIFFEEFKNHWR
ncbi:phosphoribosylanthranilate isomerase [Stygiobacter electus]|uniref:N-(5'-phosphoribosyl)anthranilate isomerase n=1 Tax=Stygiobacter electus TaxID=3032292 RepID=A0AAE3P2E9_9BACT|nr:phosphoribosylanthranilate isomerase [Stygiobacter electus]MDF1613169.1 phosphoribosylanthranilate isomerase [Stygiobacter electus]